MTEETNALTLKKWRMALRIQELKRKYPELTRRQISTRLGCSMVLVSRSAHVVVPQWFIEQEKKK